MKVRKGFVSNSSSSSFVIGIKTKISKAKLREKLVKLFDVPKKSPLYHIAIDMAKVLVNCSEKMSKKEYMEDCGYEDDSEIEKVYKKIFDNDYTFFSGHVASDGDDYAEIALVEMDLDYEDDDAIIYKEGGF